MYPDFVIRKAMAFLGCSTAEINHIMRTGTSKDTAEIVEDAIMAGFNIQAAMVIKPAGSDVTDIRQFKEQMEALNDDVTLGRKTITDSEQEGKTDEQ